MARPNDIGWAWGSSSSSPSSSSRPNDLTSLQIGDTSPATHVGWDAITIIIIPKIMGVALHQKSNAEGYISKKYKPTKNLNRHCDYRQGKGAPPGVNFLARFRMARLLPAVTGEHGVRGPVL